VSALLVAMAVGHSCSGEQRASAILAFKSVSGQRLPDTRSWCRSHSTSKLASTARGNVTSEGERIEAHLAAAVGARRILSGEKHEVWIGLDLRAERGTV